MITPAQVAAINTTNISHAWDVDSWTNAHLGAHFLEWFNANIANKGPWAGVQIVDSPENRLGHHAFWNNAELLFGGPGTAFQYLCLMSIFANETRANFTPQAERMGRQGFPGMTYLYDRIPNLKRSYNTLAGNKTAFHCFRSAAFNAAHSAKPLAGRLQNTNDVRWQGEVYPRNDFPTQPDPAIAGYVIEADFMKFRGRGFIQTTGRANYRKLIDYVKAYDGDDATIDFYQLRWQNLSPGDAADASSNADWDTLFGNTSLRIATEAVRAHNAASGNYLALAGAPDAAVRNMGKRISGGDAYAQKYLDRVTALIAEIAP